MQTPTAAPRNHLTAAQVEALLTAANVEVDFGADLLNADLSYAGDLSGDLVGGQVSRNMNAKIHGTCTLSLARELRWGVDLVRPWMVLSGGQVEARWNVGVFALTTPERRVGEVPELFEVQGYDRLLLLDRQVGADYSVTGGTTYRQALLDVFAAAGLSGVDIDGSAADNTLPTTRDWPLVALDQSDPDQTNTPVTWLRIVNDLLRAINFRAVWADQDGTFRCSAYQDPASRATEFTFDADSGLTIVGEERTLSEDVWAMPNRWVFRQTNRPEGAPLAGEGDGIYTVTLEGSHPMSAANRGLVWTSVIDYEAASQAKLVALGDRRVASDKATTSRLAATTGPFPGAGHADVFSYRDTAIGDRKVQAVGWSFDLAGGDVSWDWERVD